MQQLLVRLTIEYKCLAEFLNVQGLIDKMKETGDVKVIDVTVKKAPKEGE